MLTRLTPVATLIATLQERHVLAKFVWLEALKLNGM